MSLTPWQVTRTISEIPEYKSRIASLGLEATIVYDKNAQSEPFAMALGKVRQQPTATEADVESKTSDNETTNQGV